MPAIPTWVIDPLSDQFQAVIPPAADTHPLGCHRPRIAHRIVFDKLVQVLRFGAGYAKIAGQRCSATTIRTRREESIPGGLFARLEQLTLEAYDHLVGLDLEQITASGCLDHPPLGHPTSPPTMTRPRDLQDQADAPG